MREIRNSKGQFVRGHEKCGGFQKGSKHTTEAKEKVRLSLLGKTGPEARNWQGGKTKIRFLIPGLIQYKQWRSDIFERDNWTCQTCGGRGRIGKRVYLEAHHTVPLAEIIEEYKLQSSDDCLACEILWDIDNGVTLCDECHSLTKGWRLNV